MGAIRGFWGLLLALYQRLGYIIIATGIAMIIAAILSDDLRDLLAP